MDSFKIIIIDTHNKSRATVATVQAESNAEAVELFCEQNSQNPAGVGGLVDIDDVLNHSIASTIAGWEPISDDEGIAIRGALIHCIKA